jgi:hypothetical protein
MTFTQYRLIDTGHPVAGGLHCDDKDGSFAQHIEHLYSVHGDQLLWVQDSKQGRVWIAQYNMRAAS